MRALVVAGSAMEDPLDLLDPLALDSPDLVFLADGGANHLLRLGDALTAGRPVVLVGDMDSISPAARRLAEERGSEVLQLPAAKDETDLEHALRVAVERGADCITVVGALGGPRLDHLLGSIALLTAPWLVNSRVHLMDGSHDVFLAQGDALVSGAAGDTVSLVPLTSEVRGVVTEHLAYPLRGETLLQGATRGVSNVMESAEARVRHGEGRLLICHYRARIPSVRPSASLACQFSLYPLRQQSLDEAIRAGLEAATRLGAPSGVSVQLQPLSTLLQGEREAVFAAVRAAFEAAEEHGSLVMVCALTPKVPAAETLADIRLRNIDGWSGTEEPLSRSE